MKKRRNFFCGLSPGKYDVLEDNVVPVSNHKGFRLVDVLNNIDDDNDNISVDSRNGKKKKKKRRRSAERGVSWSPVAPISPLCRCLSLFRSVPGDSSSFSGKNSSPWSKGEDFGSNGEEIKVFEKSVQISVSRKLDFSSSEVSPRIVLEKQNSRKLHKSDGEEDLKNNNNNTAIDTPKNNDCEEAETENTKDEADRCQLKASSTMFNSRRKGENLTFPARIVPELLFNVVSCGTKQSRRKFSKHLRPQRTKSSKRPGIIVSRSLLPCSGLTLDDRASLPESKIADSAVGIPPSEKICKQGDSAKYTSSAPDCNPLPSKNKQEKDWQDQEEYGQFLKKKKAAYGLPVLPSRDALNRDSFKFPAAAKPREELLFNFGLGFGVLFMVTSSKNEIDKLRELLKQTESLVKDLKQEVNRRDLCNDSSPTVHIDKNPISEHHQDTNGKMGDSKGEVAYESQCSSKSLAGGLSSEECDVSAHSVITTEFTQQDSGMAQLEAELEAELERMQLDLTAGSSSNRTRLSGSETMDDIVLDIAHGDLDATGIVWKKRNPEQGDGHGAYYGVCPIELEKRLHQLLQKRQEEHIAELEADLKSTEKKLIDKERELSLWKECVWQLSEQSLGATTIPGEDCIASISTGGESSRSFSMPSSFQQDLIREKSKLKDSEALSCYAKTSNCSPRMKHGSQGHFDMKVETSADTDSLDEDWKHLTSPQNSRGKAISTAQCVTDKIPTIACKACVKGGGSERKESYLLDMRRRVSQLEHPQNYSTARTLVTDMCPSPESDAFQCRNFFSSLSVSNTPVGHFSGNINSQITDQKILHNSFQHATYSDGAGEIRSPVLKKIRHWEALSRGETSSRQSYDLDNQALSPKSASPLASVIVKGDSNFTAYHQEDSINCF